MVEPTHLKKYAHQIGPFPPNRDEHKKHLKPRPSMPRFGVFLQLQKDWLVISILFKGKTPSLGWETKVIFAFQVPKYGCCGGGGGRKCNNYCDIDISRHLHLHGTCLFLFIWLLTQTWMVRFCGTDFCASSSPPCLGTLGCASQTLSKMQSLAKCLKEDPRPAKEINNFF